MFSKTDNGYNVQFDERMRKCFDGQIRGVYVTDSGDTGIIISGEFVPDEPPDPPGWEGGFAASH